MTKESRINEEISEMSEALERTLTRKNGEAFREVSRSRLSVSDVLAKYTQEDGTINPIHATAILNEISAIEGEIYRNLRDYLRHTSYETAEESSIGLVEILLIILGAKVLTDFAGIPSDILSAEVDVGAILFGVLIGMNFSSFSRSAENAVFNRKGDDGLQLNDRLRRLATSLRIEVSNVLRQGILRREKVAELLRKVEKKFEEVSNRVRTIIETEVFYAHRQVISRFAEMSGIATGIKIVDHPHGDHAVHYHHKCAVYARANEHGMGRGVYPVTTRKIRNPHPQCRSTLHLVLADELK